MKFSILTEKEFKDFVYNHELSSFYQTINWGLLKEQLGWKMHLVGVKRGKRVCAASMLLSKVTPIKKNMFYAPRGFILDYNDFELLSFFTEQIKVYAKRNKAIFIKLDPYLLYQERDINGEIVENGLNNKKAFEDLIKLGYKHMGFNTMQEELQPRWMFTTSTKNRTIDEIMKEMDAKTRQILRKNERNLIKVREIGYDEIPKFKDIIQHTGDRRGFIDRPLSYYQNMYKFMDKDKMVKFTLAELNTEELIESYVKEVDKLNEEIKLREDNYNRNPEKVNKEKMLQKQKKAKDEIGRFEKNIKHIKSLKKKYGKVLTLGGILFFVHGNEVLSSVGGSYKEFMEFQSAYTLHFWGIKYAVEHNFERYNFYGITGNFDESNPLFGLYSFKRDFGGQVVELLGEFNLIVDKPAYMLFKVAFKSYGFVKNLKNRLKKHS